MSRLQRTAPQWSSESVHAKYGQAPKRFLVSGHSAVWVIEFLNVQGTQIGNYEICQMYIDNSRKLVPEKECDANNSYCCGTCRKRFCCSTPSLRIDQDECPSSCKIPMDWPVEMTSWPVTTDHSRFKFTPRPVSPIQTPTAISSQINDVPSTRATVAVHAKSATVVHPSQLVSINIHVNMSRRLQAKLNR